MISEQIMKASLEVYARKGNLKKVVNLYVRPVSRIVCISMLTSEFRSTTLGSMDRASVYSPFPVPAYKVTKAALNMLTVQYGLSFAKDGFTFVAVSPGVSSSSPAFDEALFTDNFTQWVKTDLGGDQADLTLEQGSQAVVDIVLRITKEDNGKFLNVHVPGWEHAEGMNQYDGEIVPW